MRFEARFPFSRVQVLNECNETQHLKINLMCRSKDNTLEEFRTITVKFEPEQVTVLKWSDHEVYLSPEAFHVRIKSIDNTPIGKLRLEFIRASPDYRFYHNSLSYYTVFSTEGEYSLIKVTGPFVIQTLTDTKLSNIMIAISRDRIESTIKSVEEDPTRIVMIQNEPRVTQFFHPSVFDLSNPAKQALSDSYINPEFSRYETQNFELADTFKKFLVNFLAFQRINVSQIRLQLQCPVWSISKRIPEEFSINSKGGILVFLDNSDEYANFWLELFGINKKVLMSPGSMIMFEGPMTYIIRGRQSKNASQCILKILFE